MFSSAPAALVVVGAGGVVSDANEPAARMFGRTAADVVGLPLGDLVAAPVPIEGARLAADAQSAQDRTLDALGVHADGTSFPIEITVAPVGDARVMAIRDARQEAARRTADTRVRRLLDTARVIPWEADVATTQFTYVGPRAVEILGYPIDEWYTDDFWPRHIHPEDREAATTLCAGATAREHDYEFEYRMIARDGRIVWLHDIVVVTRLRGVPQLISGYMIDITGRKQAEAERERLLEETRSALRLRDEFLSLAAHELRTPLARVGLRLHAIQRALQKEVSRTDLARSLERATDNVRRLAELVNDLLDVSHIARGTVRLRRERLDLSAVAREVVATFKDAAGAAGCAIELDAAAPVEGSWDHARIEQVITTLLGNAIKFGAGKPIEIRVGPDATLSVRDHGIGIATEDQERIFERFARAVPSSSYAGLGVGLYAASEIVRAHGGTIQVESAPGSGATFIVRLPRGCAPLPTGNPDVHLLHYAPCQTSSKPPSPGKLASRSRSCAAPCTRARTPSSSPPSPRPAASGSCSRSR
ncbi:MAG: PAS domain S-box protein [Deltaproteobacteria bacterium]|nr:PAS domain S-box protein [Deltaproteobacteria bacterium]